MISGLDWAPNTNRIVSCSHDKNAFVWTLVGNVWKPELVLVRANRAATTVKWSPLGRKFLKRAYFLKKFKKFFMNTKII